VSRLFMLAQPSLPRRQRSGITFKLLQALHFGFSWERGRANENRSSELRALRSKAFPAARSDFISTGLQPGDQKPSIEIETVSTVSPTIHR
jgi:hypothetical protein